MYCISWILTVLLTSSVTCQTLVSRRCSSADADTCYILYHNNNAALSHQVANQSCLDMGEQLVTIPDSATQAILSQLSQAGSGHAWIGGKQIASTMWHTNAPGGSRYTTVTIDDDNDADKMCSVLRLHATNRRASIPAAVKCTSDAGRRAMCQYPLVGSALCDRYSFNISNICYTISADSFTTYAAAEDHCEAWATGTTRAESQPTLAYSTVDSEQVRDAFWYNYRVRTPTRPEDNQLWLKLRRTPVWKWLDGTDVVTEIMYTKWKQGEPDDALSEPCMAVDLSSPQAFWVSRNCDDNILHYICTGQPATTATTTTTAATTTTTTTSDVTASVTTTTTAATTTTTTLVATSTESGASAPTTAGKSLANNNPDLNGTTLVLIVVFSVGGFLFIIGVIVAAYVSCSLKKDDPHEDKNDTYNEPEGVASTMHAPRNGVAVSHMQGISKNRASRVPSSQLNEIFITPQIGQQPQQTNVVNVETGETNQLLYGRSLASQATEASGSFADIKDDSSYNSKPFGAGNQTYAGGARSQGSHRSKRSVVTLQSMEQPRAAAPHQHNQRHPSPPISQAVRRSNQPRHVSRVQYQPSTSTDTDVPFQPPPPPPLPPSGSLLGAPTPPEHTPRSSRPPSPDYMVEAREFNALPGSMGRPDLADDNMMF